MALRFSLKTKISMVVFFLVAGVLMISGAIFFHYFERSLIENISDQQFTLVTKLADEIDTSIGIGQEIISRAAARITPEIMGNADLAQTFLDDHLGSILPIFDNGVFLFSAKGLMVAETPFIPGRRGKDYSFRDYVSQTVTTGHPLISTPYFSSQEHGHPAVSFTAPVHDSHGGVIGLLAGSLDLTHNNMLGRLARTKIGNTGYLYLYSTDRLMIMHPKGDRLLKKDVPPGVNLLFDRAIDGFEGSGETVNSRGFSSLSSFKRLSRVNWILAANYPRDEVYAPVVKAQYYFVFGLILSLLVATLVAWLAMQRLVAPLQYFIGHIESAVVNRENLKPLEVGTGDEISTLADAFIRLMHEITVQKQNVEQQLLFQKILIDTIPNPIYYKNLKGEYLGCNKAFEQLYNCTDDEIIGSTSEKFVPMEMAKALGDADAELYRQQVGEFQIFEYAATYVDNSRHDLLFYKAMFKDVIGNPAGLVGTIVDITERKSMERALYEEQKFAENLLQNSAVPSFVLDMNHKVLVWTTACEELTGMAAGELIGTDDHWKAFYSQKRPCLADLVIDRDIERTLDFYSTFSSSQLIPEGLQAEGWFPDIRGKRRYLRFEAAPI
ncbi:MAG: PAS domain-containing protein, partial [Desulfuromonadales bacterium]|nr:PAS domain-containing protein [Desulfuromonadales bacterium]